MTVTIINDCLDGNARARQIIRTQSFFPQDSVVFIGVKNDLEASGNLIDCLDAYGESKGVIMLNVAPRNNHKNSSDFCYFRYKNVLAVATIGGYCLSLAKKLGLIDDVNLIKEVGDGQFRSYTWLPGIASALEDKASTVANERMDIKEVKDAPLGVWLTDCFGNQKTTLLESEMKSYYYSLPFYRRLVDVPLGEKGIIVGSSGIGEKRFLEIVVRRDIKELWLG